MYLAELHGKLSSRTERMEDILTSNVFSFFKYSNREVFLKEYLKALGFIVSSDAAINANFIFWPRFEKNTEPDLVIRVGGYYILIEAKYFSDFAPESKKTKAQLLREIEGGKLEAKNYKENFRLIAITADHYYKKDKFKIIPSDFLPKFKWTNWQTVASFLENILENTENISRQERAFASDLYDLLDRKNLREFRGTYCLSNINHLLRGYASIFFEARTAIFRGGFIGFTNSLLQNDRISPLGKTLFFGTKRKIFESLTHIGKLKTVESHLFYRRY